MVNSLKKVLLSTSTPRTAREPSGEIDGVGVIDAREPPQARLAEQRQMNGEGEAAEAGVGADVGGRLVALDVLFARRQRQHEAAPPVRVDRLAAEAPGHLAQIFRSRREEADIRAAEIQAVADRLAFADDDVGAHLARRLDEAERDGLGEDGDEQRALRPA